MKDIELRPHAQTRRRLRAQTRRTRRRPGRALPWTWTSDWTPRKGWSKVRYDPWRLIQGAQEAGFVELEEISMKDIDFGPAGSSGGKEKGAGKGKVRVKAPSPRWTSRSSRRWTSPRTTTTTATSTRTSSP